MPSIVPPASPVAITVSRSDNKLPDSNPIIRAHRKVTAPSSLHGVRPLHAIAHRIHKEMVRGHEGGQCVNVVTIDRSHEPLERFGGTHRARFAAHDCLHNDSVAA